MDSRSHWDAVYRTKSPPETSWFQPHLQTSLEWISEAAPDLSASIIDVGGGESTLVDDLLTRGYRAVTVLDISDAAMRKSRERLGHTASCIEWLVSDVTQVSLPARNYDLWHDRAVFHFLTEAEQRSAYRTKVISALKPGGHVVVATFGPEGPERCSGLVTRRYDAEALQNELGADFGLVTSALVDHRTPIGTSQQFLYCHFTLADQLG